MLSPRIQRVCRNIGTLPLNRRSSIGTSTAVLTGTAERPQEINVFPILLPHLDWHGECPYGCIMLTLQPEICTAPVRCCTCEEATQLLEILRAEYQALLPEQRSQVKSLIAGLRFPQYNICLN